MTPFTKISALSGCVWWRTPFLTGKESVTALHQADHDWFGVCTEQGCRLHSSSWSSIYGLEYRIWSRAYSIRVIVLLCTCTQELYYDVSQQRQIKSEYTKRKTLTDAGQATVDTSESKVAGRNLSIGDIQSTTSRLLCTEYLYKVGWNNRKNMIIVMVHRNNLVIIHRLRTCWQTLLNPSTLPSADSSRSVFSLLFLFFCFFFSVLLFSSKDTGVSCLSFYLVYLVYSVYVSVLSVLLAYLYLLSWLLCLIRLSPLPDLPQEQVSLSIFFYCHLIP